MMLQEAPGSPRRLQDALEAPGAPRMTHETLRRPEEALGGPRRLQDVSGGSQRSQEPK